MQSAAMQKITIITRLTGSCLHNKTKNKPKCSRKTANLVAKNESQ